MIRTFIPTTCSYSVYCMSVFLTLPEMAALNQQIEHPDAALLRLASLTPRLPLVLRSGLRSGSGTTESRRNAFSVLPTAPVLRVAGLPFRRVASLEVKSEKRREKRSRRRRRRRRRRTPLERGNCCGQEGGKSGHHGLFCPPL